MKIFIPIFILFLSIPVFAGTPEEDIALIQQIQNLTRDNNWVPGMTSLARLSSQEFAQLCGFQGPMTMTQSVREEEISVRGSANLLDLGIVPAIRNQAKCGSCWAFAMTGCVEIVNGGKVDLSEQHLVGSCKDGCNGCSGGSIGSVAAWIIRNGGIITESVCPYTSGDGVTRVCENISGSKYTISGYSSATSSTIKSALDSGKPTDTGMYVYEDFRYYTSGIYKHTTGNYLGGHAVIIVGYNDAEGYWLVRNSWGTSWGDKGYFKIAYGECNIPWMAVYVK